MLVQCQHRNRCNNKECKHWYVHHDKRDVIRTRTGAIKRVLDPDMMVSCREEKLYCEEAKMYVLCLPIKTEPALKQKLFPT